MTEAPNANTALVVEDEMLFRLEVRDLLEADGYAVVEAGNAVQALERLGDGVVLMVTDVRMPGRMGGLALAREVNRRRPDVAVVVVSAQVTPRPGDLPDHIPSSSGLSSRAASATPSIGPRRPGKRDDDADELVLGRSARGLVQTEGRIRISPRRPRRRWSPHGRRLVTAA